MTSWRPPHAYIPGKTPRHPEDLFEVSTRETIGNTLESLETSDAYKAGWALYDDKFYWEAHEMWEPVWMACPQNSAEKLFLQAIIQAANAKLKVLMERPNAAMRLNTDSQRLAAEAFGRKDGAIFGFTPDELTKRLNL